MTIIVGTAGHDTMDISIHAESDTDLLFVYGDQGI